MIDRSGLTICALQLSVSIQMSSSRKFPTSGLAWSQRLLKSVNAPTNEAPDSTKISFYRQLCRHLSVRKHEKLIVLGDYNATISAVKEQRMIDFFRDNKLSAKSLHLSKYSKIYTLTLHPQTRVSSLKDSSVRLSCWASHNRLRWASVKTQLSAVFHRVLNQTLTLSSISKDEMYQQLLGFDKVDLNHHHFLICTLTLWWGFSFSIQLMRDQTSSNSNTEYRPLAKNVLSNVVLLLEQRSLTCQDVQTILFCICCLLILYKRKLNLWQLITSLHTENNCILKTW